MRPQPHDLSRDRSRRREVRRFLRDAPTKAVWRAGSGAPEPLGATANRGDDGRRWVSEPSEVAVGALRLLGPPRRARVLVDKNNGGRWRWISEPFGTTTAEEAPGGLTPVTLNLRFPGQYLDKESGLSYNYFRDYDGTIGRYVQSDPTGLAAGTNTFAYVNGMPASAIDPFGLFEVKYFPSTTFDKRKYPKNVQELYRHAAYLKGLIDKACPANSRAHALYEKWVVEIVDRSGDPTTKYGLNTSEFTRDYFDVSTHRENAPDNQFTFAHEFMHLTEANNQLRPSNSAYIEAFINNRSNELPFEKNADKLVRDLMNGKCPCD